MAQAAEVESGKIEVSPERMDEVLNELLTLRKNESSNKWREGELLAEVLDGGYYDRYGFQSFEHFCQEKMGYTERTGFRRVVIWRKFGQELGFEFDSLAEYPWSKLELVAAIVKKSNVEGWLKDCQKLSYDQLRYKVSELQVAAKEQDGKGKKRGEGGGKRKGTISTRERGEGAEGEDGNEPKVVFSVTMYQSQYDNLKAAISMACGQLETRKVNYALDMIAADFQATGLTSANDGGSLKRAQVILEDIGRAFNMNITATMKEGSVADQFRKDRESSIARKKKLREQQAAQSAKPEDGKPKAKRSKKK
jgi:hypothetical protein